MKRAIFLDRDGTIIKDRGFLKDPKGVVFYKGTFESLRELQKHFLLFIITNQPGIGKGFLSTGDVENIHNYINACLKEENIIIQHFYFCPHLKSDNCKCRKPATFFIEQAVKGFKINVSASFVIGDHPSDVQLALNAGAKGIYVLTGHGRKHAGEIPVQNRDSIKICRDIHFASGYILRQIGA